MQTRKCLDGNDSVIGNEHAFASFLGFPGQRTNMVSRLKIFRFDGPLLFSYKLVAPFEREKSMVWCAVQM